jgi:hypothetical protein
MKKDVKARMVSQCALKGLRFKPHHQQQLVIRWRFSKFESQKLHNKKPPGSYGREFHVSCVTLGDRRGSVP